MCYQFLLEVMDFSNRVCVIAGNDTIHWICALDTSPSFPNLPFKIVFALSHLSVLNGRPSIKVLIFEITNFFKYEYFLTVVISAQSIIFVSNLPQNLNQSKFSHLNLIIFNFGSFISTGFFLNCMIPLPSLFSSNSCQISISVQVLIFVDSTLPQSDLPLLFFLHCSLLSVLLFCFEAPLLAHHFLVL